VTAASGSVAVGTDGVTETALDYTLMRYSNGDVEVSCTSGIGSRISASFSTHYPAPTVGATTGNCTNPGTDYPVGAEDLVAGAWVYTLKPQPHATYEDVSTHLLNGFSVSFGPNDCHAFVADDKGVWMDAALSDVL
jgi:hypothetical protein